MAAHRLRIGHVGQVRVPLGVPAVIPLEDLVDSAIDPMAPRRAGIVDVSQGGAGPEQPAGELGQAAGKSAGEDLAALNGATRPRSITSC